MTTSSKFTTSNSGFDLAWDRFAQGDFLGAFAQCREILSAQPGDVPALLLFSRLCMIAGEDATAVSLLELALQQNRRCDIAHRLLYLVPYSPPYARAVAIDPDIERHTNQYVFAAPLPLPQHVEAALLEARAAKPDFADIHAALGNAYIRLGRIADGLASYEAAVALAPGEATFRLGLAERLRLLRDAPEASAQLTEGLARSCTFLEPATDEEEFRVRALYSADFWEKFVALDLLVDRASIAVEKYYAPGPAQNGEVSPDVLFNAITDPEDVAALEWAAGVARDSGMPVLNDPALLARTSRTYLSEIPPVHPQLRIPAVRRYDRSTLKTATSAFAFPLLARPLGSHRGEGLQRIGDERALEDYEKNTGEGHYVVSEFIDYKSADGFYRKYRWIFIDGEPYPHHLAISHEWMVHYFSAPMREHAWMRDEESVFLNAPRSVFGKPQIDALRALGRTIGLDYFGVDCGVHNGSIVVFEANANMLAHDFFGEPEFAYKREPFNELRAAFDRMLRKARP